MKKIVYVVSTLRSTGPTRQLYNIIKHLDRDRFSPTVVTLSPEPENSKWDDFTNVCDAVETLGLSRVKGALVGRHRLKAKLAALVPDIIHTQGFRADYLLSKIDIDAKKFTTIRNYPQIDFVDYYGGIFGRIMTRLQLRAISKFTVCVCVSRAVEENLRKQGANAVTEVITNGVDIKTFNRIDDDVRATLRTKFGFASGSRVWVVLGDLIPRKDPDFIVDAMSNAHQSLTGIEVVFAGGGDMQDKLERHAGEGVRFLGAISNPDELLKAADYVLSASKAEGLPNAIIEGMACGLPALLSDIAPHTDLLGSNFDCGALYRLGDQEDFINQMTALISRNYSEMSEAARALMVDQYSDIQMSKSYQTLYSQPEAR